MIKQLTFRPVRSASYHDSHPFGVEVTIGEDVLETFWYTTIELRDQRYKTLGNMNDEFLTLFDRLLNA